MQRPVTKYPFLCSCLILLFACGKSREGDSVDASMSNDTITKIPITFLANLPDSAKPKTVLLENGPKPVTVQVPNGKGQFLDEITTDGKSKRIQLEPPVEVAPAMLRDAAGQLILDSIGNPFVLGEGGLSGFTAYNTDNGLPMDVIASSCTDQFGNIWFGTFGGGVSKFDGKSFTNYTTAHGLANDNVRSIILDKSNNLWFGTDGGGVSRYDGVSFITFSTANGLANDNVRCMAFDSSGNLWFGTYGGGVSRYDGKSFTTFSTANGLSSDYITCIITDRNGHLWFGTEGGGVSRYDGRKFTNYTNEQGLPAKNVRSICMDAQGYLWFGCDNGIISRFNGNQFTTYSASNGIPPYDVMACLADLKGNVWFGTNGGGAVRYDGKSFTSFSKDQGLKGVNLACMNIDKEGDPWFGTMGAGVFRYNGKAFSTFSTPQGLPNGNVLSIIKDLKGDLWFGTYGGGLSRFNGKSFTNFSTAQGFPGTKVRGVAQDRSGNLWFGVIGEGLTRYDYNSFTTFNTSQGLPSNILFSLLTDRDGYLWMGTYGGGVSRFDGKSFTSYSVPQGLCGDKIWSMAQDADGVFWFGSYGGGVSRYDGKSFTTFSKANGLTGDVVFDIHIDPSGSIWFATDEGLGFLSNQSKKHISKAIEKAQATKSVVKWLDLGSTESLFKSITIAQGLSDNLVTQVTEDGLGRIWAGTNNGISLIESKNGNPKVLRQFTSASGSPIKDVNAGHQTMYLDDKDILWIGTGSEKSGLVRFDLNAIPQAKTIPRVQLTGLRLGEAKVCWHSIRNLETAPSAMDLERDSIIMAQQEARTIGMVLSQAQRDSLRKKFIGLEFDGISPFYPLPTNLSLPYRMNSVSIDFAAIETGVNNAVRYKYILDGYGNDWSPETESTSATFGNIDEGSYVFRLKARMPQGDWSEEIVYAFTVRPPWYRTWWAYLIFGVFFVMSLVAFVRWRERKLRKEKERLEHLVALRTAEVVEEKKEVERQKKRSDDLLLNILPVEVAEELKEKGSADAKQFQQVTVMFTDFKGFTQFAENISAKELVAEIDHCFKAFDHIIGKHGIEKIKTIGDAYMCAGGLPVANDTH
ncbi:MAG: hypothetical protein RL090_1810, partial [Bacteroidota bacterium]